MAKIAIRVYTKLKKEDKFNPKQHSKPDLSKVLVFDCETRTDYYQNLTFGSYRYYNRSLGENYLEETAIFYDPKIVTDKELTILKTYSAKHNLRLITADEFVKRFYYFMLNKKAVCVGHNLAFDISRLVKRFGTGRRHNKGNFSLMISQDDGLPRIRTKRRSEGKVLLDFGGVRWHPKYNGTFVDTQILASALFDAKRISLEDLPEKLGLKEHKMSVNEHGKVTSEYIEYNLQDTALTYLCFNKLIEKYNEFELDEPIHRIFSAASLGKAVFRKIGIKGFQELNKTISPKIIGNVMSAFYGGRSEVKCRKQPVRETVLDFTSMYPTMGLLMGTKELVIAKDIGFTNCTEEIQKLLDKITLTDLYDANTWKGFIVLCKIKPDGDCLPVRSDYNGVTYNIGINYLKSEKELYYFLPDLIFSKLITGKAPKIIEAMRFYTKEVQSNLKEIKLFGVTLNPYKDDFIKLIVEERARVKGTDKSKAHGLKITANSTTYGIFVEMHQEKEKQPLTTFSNSEFECINYQDKPGEYYSPIIATALISGARLLLGMVEKELDLLGESHFACDTDSCFVPPETANYLQNKFQKLNPYTHIKHLLKKEGEPAWFYGISAKRYVLYELKNGQIIIKDPPKGEKSDYRLHGLGHILNPFGKDKKDWHKIIWQDILEYHYGKITAQQIQEKYACYYAISRITNSTPQIAKRFASMNKNKPIESQIKPFNFLLTGTSTDAEIKPIAPNTDNPQEIVYNQFVNYKSNKPLKGEEYWQTLSEFIFDYMDHPESKLDGKTGFLKRKHLASNEIVHIGKETKNIEDRYIEKATINEYKTAFSNEEIKKITWQEAKAKGIPKSTYFYKKSD